MLIQRWFAGILSTILLAVIFTAQATPLGLMVPAYFYPKPKGAWDDLDAAAARVPLIVIMNPASGPGKSKDVAYVQALAKLHQAGGKATGYIHTSYGERPLAEVEKEIDLYLSFYSLDGFFIDEMTNDQDTRHLDYYAAIYKYIKAKDARYSVTGNPGCNTQEEYVVRPTDDSLMIFEDNSTNYAGFMPANWVAKYSARQFVHLPYAVTTAAQMTNDVQLAVSRNAGWICVTDEALPNPYKGLPQYWKNEVDLVAMLNRNTAAADLQQTAKR